ncbi:MAG TPA: GNAT family N-acetyltransferase [Nocardioidaceae bacterium]|nr:GNAT family N-acetyltransferase [Nocardioidaceae bacterium]
MLLRPVEDTDIDDVLALNERNVTMLAPMDETKLRLLRGIADRFDVIEVDGAFAGLVVTFAPGAPYDSPYYRWFSGRYDDFCYLDRIVLHEDLRRRGLGSAAYDEIESSAKQHGRMLLEVNLTPRNEPSLAFHAGRGYAEVGRLGDDVHLVSLQEKPL